MKTNTARFALSQVLEVPALLFAALQKHPENARDFQREAVALFYDVALGAIEGTDWKPGKRLLRNSCGEIPQGILKRFSKSNLAFAMVMFRFWTTPEEKALPHEPIREWNTRQQNQPQSSSNQDSQESGDAGTGSEDGSSTEEEGIRKEKRNQKICVGENNTNMFLYYRKYKAMMRKFTTGDDDESSMFLDTVAAWDQFIKDRDDRQIARKKRKRRQEDVDPGNDSTTEEAETEPDAGAAPPEDDDDSVAGLAQEGED